jgi:DNA-directed RNA polymerase subunit omega
MQLLPVELLDKIYGTRYGVVVAAAKRARHIRQGATPLTETSARNPLTIALLELAAGKVFPQPPAASAEETETADSGADERGQAEH